MHDPLRWAHEDALGGNRFQIHLEWTPTPLPRQFGVLQRKFARSADSNFEPHWLHPDHLTTVDRDGTWAYWRKPFWVLRPYPHVLFAPSVFGEVIDALARAGAKHVKGYWVPTGWRSLELHTYLEACHDLPRRCLAPERYYGDGLYPAEPNAEDWFELALQLSGDHTRLDGRSWTHPGPR